MGKLSRGGGGSGSRVGVMMGGGGFDGHGGEGGSVKGRWQGGFLIGKTRGVKQVLILLEKFLGMGKLGFR